MPFNVDVMSYNIRYDNPHDQEYVWRKRRDQVASVIRFHDPDIVGLQEALFGQLQDLADRLPDYEWLPAGRTDGQSENAGEYAAIGYDACRFNLEDESTFWLSESPDQPGSVGWDAMLARLVKYVRFRELDTGVEFYHFNTHFDHAGETARTESAVLLRERIDEETGRFPVVVTGDFNARSSDPTYRKLVADEDYRRRLLDAHFAANYAHHGPETTVTDFTSLIPEKKIDHVLVTPEIEVFTHGACADTFSNGEYPSDHLPLLVRLSIPGRTATKERI